MGLLDSIISAESGGNPNARNPNSSASGLGQFIDSTWLATIREARPDLAQGKSDAELLALKTNGDLSKEMTQAYANKNQGVLTQNGLPVTDGNTYLAHFAGPGGAVKVLQSDPSASVADILGPAVVKANPFLARMTAGDLQAWASKKVGGSTPQPAAPQAPAAAPANGLLAQAPGGLIPPETAQAPQGGGLMAPPPIEQMQMAPIQYAQRRQPDLSKLKALFKAPTFRG